MGGTSGPWLFPIVSLTELCRGLTFSGAVFLLQAFEREIFRASTRQPAEGESNIFMCKGLVVLYRTQDETTFYVVGAEDENEVILVSSCFIQEPIESCQLHWRMPAQFSTILHCMHEQVCTHDNKCGRWESVVRC